MHGDLTKHTAEREAHLRFPILGQEGNVNVTDSGTGLHTEMTLVARLPWWAYVVLALVLYAVISTAETWLASVRMSIELSVLSESALFVLKVASVVICAVAAAVSVLSRSRSKR
jgi:hypothetical protein